MQNGSGHRHGAASRAFAVALSPSNRSGSLLACSKHGANERTWRVIEHGCPAASLRCLPCSPAMSLGSTIVLTGLVVVLLFALYTRLRAQAASGAAAANLGTACFFCKRRQSTELVLKACTGCRVNRYCSENCQTRDWSDHKAFCKYIQACRQTTHHDALILPADGGPAHLRRLAFSVEGACHPSALFLRAADLRAIFGAEIQQTRLHRITTKDQPTESDNGEYIMYYTISPRLPPNKHLLYYFRLDELPQDRPFWRGDVVIVKSHDKFLDRPRQFQKFGGTAPEVDYFNVKMSFLPATLNWMIKFYEVGFAEAEKNEEAMAKLRAQDERSLRQRKSIAGDVTR